jgi:2-polyprenyl-6-hydroxyphenyl methylase/3-demethylubiquinone-9 3-methyltransferase
MGAEVVGATAARATSPCARLHAEDVSLAIYYRTRTAEQVAAEGERPFDVVPNMEGDRAWPKPQAYLRSIHTPYDLGPACQLHAQPQRKSYLMAIVGAEQVMRWLPRGTHDWRKFITPDELFDMLRRAGCGRWTGWDGLQPVAWSWRLSERDLSVNYVTASVRD